MASGTKPLPVIILSGGTGRTGEGVLKAALAQFDRQNVKLVVKGNVRTVRSALAVVRKAAKEGAIICHTLVSPNVREAVIKETDRHKVPTVDILGPVMRVLDDYLEAEPLNIPGLSYTLQKEHFDRIDAVDFTLEHDDGRRFSDLEDADVVLVGVSRVSKSVTCFYLAYRGIRAANVPIVVGWEAPEELLRLDPTKVIGLTMNATRLANVRSARVDRLGGRSLGHYADADQIGQELRYASSLMSRHGWPCIDVSYKSVEEVAKEILEAIGR